MKISLPHPCTTDPQGFYAAHARIWVHTDGERDSGQGNLPATMILGYNFRRSSDAGRKAVQHEYDSSQS